MTKGPQSGLGQLSGRALRRAIYTALRAARFYHSARAAVLERRVTELERVTSRIGVQAFKQDLTLILLQAHVGYWPEPAGPPIEDKPGSGTGSTGGDGDGDCSDTPGEKDMLH